MTSLSTGVVPSKVLDGIVDQAELARELKCSTRTVIRLAPPSIRIGGRVLYRIETVRAWLLEHERQSRPEPRRGRPRTKRAA